MDSAMSIAASGMQAASLQLMASASNIANVQSDGPLAAGAPAASAYQPVTVNQATAPGGGVQASLSSVTPGSVLAYDPGAPFANLQGMVAAPNVDPAAEMMNQLTASIAFKANLAVFKAAESDDRALFQTMA